MRLRKMPARFLCLCFGLSLFVVIIAWQTRGAEAAPRGTDSAGQRPSTANLAWTQFQDPFEKAFKVEVPQGWTVKGGLFRLGYSDQRVMVDLRSPDGATNIRLGDISIPSYTVPVQFHEREGEVYDLGAQAQMVVAHYRTGPEFTVFYYLARFGGSCRNPQADPSDSSVSIADYLPVNSNANEKSSGEIAQRCDIDAGPRVSFASTKTALYGKIWQVPEIVSFMAPPDQASTATAIVRHMAETFRLNPQWLEYQKRMDADGLQYQRARQEKRVSDLQAQVQQFEANMRAMQNQVKAFERHRSAQASQVAGFTNALIGITPTTDPLTGENRQVWTGSKSNYWVNGNGQVINSNAAPAPGWRQLQPN